MLFELEIQFGKSPSKSYPQAIRLLKNFSTIVLADSDEEESSVTVSRHEFVEKHRKVSELWELVGNWKRSRLLINGEPAKVETLNACWKIIGCYEEFKTAVIQEEHCWYLNKEGWGCKWLTQIDRYFPDISWGRHKYWYEFGCFESETKWRIDKEKMRVVFQREVDLKKVSLCPVFDRAKIEDIIDSFPDQIDTAKSEGKWEIVHEHSFEGITAERRPIRIRPVSGRTNVISLPLDELPEKVPEPNIDTPAIQREIPTVSFSEIGGIDDIVETIREVVELPIKKPAILKHLGIKPHKGILLYGAPGTGKTLIAKAIANEIKAHFISIKGPELFSKWHGQSEENLRSIFKEARCLQPSIIYFDEIDSIAQIRSGDESSRLDARFVNQLLTLMDGMEDYGNVRVIASTNRVELIDSALLRPGRFDYAIEVRKPTLEGCYTIFGIHAKAMPIDPEFDRKLFSEQLLGLTGAEIAFVAREAAYNCLRRNVDLRKAIENDELDLIDYRSFVITETDFLAALSALSCGVAGQPVVPR